MTTASALTVTPRVTPRGKPRCPAAAQLADAIRLHQTSLLRYAMHLLPDRPDEGQDVVQEAFLRYRATLLNGRLVQAPAPWLYRVTHNLAVDLNRRGNRQCELDETATEKAEATVGTGSTAGPVEELCRREAGELAVAELERLPDDDRQILMMKVIHGATLQDISRATGMKISTIHYRLTRGLRILGRRLIELGAV